MTEPFLFNDKTRPMIDQIVEMMEYLEYDKKLIEKVQNEFKKGNLEFVTNMVQTLAMQFVGKNIFKALEENDKSN